MSCTPYNYYNNLLEHVGKNYEFFSDTFVFPRQLEIHLPGNHKTHCNLNCKWCQGSNFIRRLNHWENIGLNLVNNLKGKIPFHIYGGAYTEPLLNPYLLSYLATTKKYGNNFGIHTNGVLLNTLENTLGYITEISRLATSKNDYVSFSIDGGIARDWAKAKNVNNFKWFDEIILSIGKLSKIKEKLKKDFSIRLCFLISESTGTEENFEAIVDVAKKYNVDSLRFSIPYAIYNQSFSKLKTYKSNTEIPLNEYYSNKLQKYLSNSKPYIFYVDPETTSVNQFTFDKCIYSYYQITLGADGNVYKCSSCAAPDAETHKIGRITDNIFKFVSYIKDSYNKDWDCRKMCFNNNLRCNRMAIEVNKEYEKLCNNR